MTSATCRALGNFDLVEDILLRLPIREVLLSKAVCKAWKDIHDSSSRIQKALFLSPASEQTIFYPDSSNPTWYRVPSHKELIIAGIVAEDDEESDDDVTPTNSPKYQRARKATCRLFMATHLEDAARIALMVGEAGHNSKFQTNVSSTTEGECEATESEVDRNLRSFLSAADDSGIGGEVGSMATADIENGTLEDACNGIGKEPGNMATADIDTLEDAYKNLGLNNPDFTPTSSPGGLQPTSELFPTSDYSSVGTLSSTNLKQKVDDEGDFTLDDRAAQLKFSYYLKNQPTIPPSTDGRMMVSRVTRPFINPFCELFVERFYRGIRGGYHLSDPIFKEGVGLVQTEQLVVRPQLRYDDGTTRGRSSMTKAVQRFDASWRKMHPFNVATASMSVECFDFGGFSCFVEGGILMAGDMMEQLGEHWASTCPDCCILDFWFSEFIREVFFTDGSDWNRGQHGVRKLGLDNTGWEILAKLNEGKIETTGIKDRINPFKTGD